MLSLSSIDGKTKSFKFWDKKAHEDILNLIEQINGSNGIIKNLDVLNGYLFDPEEGVSRLFETRLIPFTSNDCTLYGLVEKPHGGIALENNFLRADGQWVPIELYADRILFSAESDVTVAEILEELLLSSSNINIQEDNSSEYIYVLGNNGSDNTLRYNKQVKIDCSNGVLFGAAWNDYAECRMATVTEAGRVVVENGDDTLSLSNDRLLLGGNIVSDTYGMLIG